MICERKLEHLWRYPYPIKVINDQKKKKSTIIIVSVDLPIAMLPLTREPPLINASFNELRKSDSFGHVRVSSCTQAYHTMS